MVNPQLLPVDPNSILTCELNSGEATHDVTSQLPLDAVIPPMTVPSPLIPGNATHYAVVRSTFAVEPHGSFANAMVTSFPAPRQGLVSHYRFVSLTSGNFMCGVSIPDLFRGGWPFPGVFLNSWNGGLVGGKNQKLLYSPSFSRQGSVVDWIMEVDGATVTVYILREGHPCGPAFILNFAGYESKISQLRPAVSFSDVAMDVAIVCFQSVAPSAAYRECSDNPIDPRYPMHGRWMADLKDWPGVPFAGPLIIDRSGIHAPFVVAVCPDAQFHPDGTIVPGPEIGAQFTNGFLHPHYATVSGFLKSLSRWELVTNATLFLTGAQGRKRFTRSLVSDPATDNPFRPAEESLDDDEDPEDPQDC